MAASSCPTTWVRVGEVLVVKLVSPAYVAVTGWVPTAKELVELDDALPPDSVTGLPKAEPSTKNWTCPVGVPAPGATGPTVAVKLTGWPNGEGLVDEVTVVVVPAGFTVWPPGSVPALGANEPDP